MSGAFSFGRKKLKYSQIVFFFLFFLFLSAPIRSEEVFDIVFDAFDDCPCLNPWVNYTNPNGDDDCLVNMFDASLGTPECYDRNTYGVDRCGLWDKGLGPACAKDGPDDYCISAFCYVDRRNCARPSNLEENSLLARSLQFISHPDKQYLAYSYETCGYLDRFSTNQQAANDLAGKTLRVSFPLPGSVGTFFSYFNEREEEYRGAVHSFMNGVLDELGVNLQFVNLSQQSLDRFPTTSFTACVHDVALGNTDFCISDFWITPQRRLMTTFTEQFEEDLFYLYVPASGNEDLPFSEILANPFRPFHRDVWLLIVAFLFFTSVCYLFLEYNNTDDFVEHDNIGSKMYHSTYQAFQSYTSASSIHVPKRKSTKMLLVGFGFFVLVMVSSYTAELASFFIREDVSVAIDSFEAGLASGYKLCGYQAVKVDFLETYPTAESAYVEVGTGGEAMTKLVAGECDMVMLAIEDWEAAQVFSICWFLLVFVGFDVLFCFFFCFLFVFVCFLLFRIIFLLLTLPSQTPNQQQRLSNTILIPPSFVPSEE